MRVHWSQTTTMFCTMSRFKTFHCTLTANSSPVRARWKEPTPLWWILLRILYWSFLNIFITFKVRHFLRQSKVFDKHFLYRCIFWYLQILRVKLSRSWHYCLDIADDPGLDSPRTRLTKGLSGAGQTLMILIQGQIHYQPSDLSRRCHPVSVSGGVSVSLLTQLRNVPQHSSR